MEDRRETFRVFNAEFGGVKNSSGIIHLKRKSKRIWYFFYAHQWFT